MDDYDFVILLNERFNGLFGYLYGVLVSFMDKWNIFDERDRFWEFFDLVWLVIWFLVVYCIYGYFFFYVYLYLYFFFYSYIYLYFGLLVIFVFGGFLGSYLYFSGFVMLVVI